MAKRKTKVVKKKKAAPKPRKKKELVKPKPEKFSFIVTEWQILYDAYDIATGETIEYNYLQISSEGFELDSNRQVLEEAISVQMSAVAEKLEPSGVGVRPINVQKYLKHMEILRATSG